MAYTDPLNEIVQGLQSKIQQPQGVLGQLDPMKLALAQGFFAPTKTGGFGESVSNAVGALQGPLKTMADQNSSIQDKILQIRLAQAKLQAQKDKDKETDMGAGVDDYSRLANAEKLYRDQFGLDDTRLFKPDGTFRSPEAEETYKQRKDKFDAAIGPMRAAIERRNAKAGFGASAGGGGQSGGQGGGQGGGGQPLKEGQVVYSPQGAPHVVKDGKLVPVQQPQG